MSGKVVDSIFANINSLPNATSIKKLLYLKLEIEFGAKRCENYDDWNPAKPSQDQQETITLEGN
jgi:hypothetical protein